MAVDKRPRADKDPFADELDMNVEYYHTLLNGGMAPATLLGDRATVSRATSQPKDTDNETP